MIVALPAATPDTIPVLAPTDAIAALLLLHVPPLTVLVNVAVLPTQAFVLPPIADGLAFTVIVVVTAQPPAGV